MARDRFDIVLIAPNVTCTWCHPDKFTQHARLTSLLVLRPKLVVTSISNEGAVSLQFHAEWPKDLWPVGGAVV